MIQIPASYIKRYPSEDENLVSFDEKAPSTLNLLSSTQKEKMSHFFSHLLDSDQDDLISEQDFENFSEVGYLFNYKYVNNFLIW